MQQDYIARRSVSRKLFFLGAAEVLLGVLLYLWALELLPIPPFPCTGVLSALGFVALGFGAYLLYWGGTLWQQAGDEEQWRQTVSRIAEKFCSHPILSLAVLAVLIAAEWVIWKTAHVAIALLAAGVLTLLFLPLFRQMRRL